MVSPPHAHRCAVLVGVGIDFKSIAVPLQADLVRAIRADPGLWEVRAFADHCRAVVARDLDLIITLY